MENLKTISGLNSKAWYRALKVIFIFVFLFVLGVFNYVSFSSGLKQINQNKTTIQCNPVSANLEDRKTFTLKSAGLLLNISDFTNKRIDILNLNNSYELNKIFEMCNISSDKITSVNYTIDKYRSGNYGRMTPFITEANIVPVFTYVPFFESLLIGNILILLIFEATRKSFYYIVLGKIKPKN